MNPGLHPNDIADFVLNVLVQRDHKIDGGRTAIRDRRNKLLKARAAFLLNEIGLKVPERFLIVIETWFARVFFEEKVERIDRFHTGDQVNFYLKMICSFGKRHSREVIRERVLLPVDEMALWQNFLSVVQYLCAGMRCGAQPDSMGRMLDEPVVAIACTVVQRDFDAHLYSTLLYTTLRDVSYCRKTYVPDAQGTTMFNEMLCDGNVRDLYRTIERWIEAHGVDALLQRRPEAEALFRRVGITFAVYGEGGDPERLIPFDMIPRIFSAQEWDIIERGSIQRANALNAFLADIYGAKEILKAGIIPKSLVEDNPGYEPIMEGIRPPRDIWAHIIGVDVVRTGLNEFFVLEDNCRTPSGVSYVLETREVMTRMFPQLFGTGSIRKVDGYPDMLATAMDDVAPSKCEGLPTRALLTPGYMNSAYYEHSFLADRMGVELVEGQDLFTRDGKLWMRTIDGPQSIDVLYRRIDDAYLDPNCFRPDSLLGVRGLMDVYREGGLTIVNAPGTGVADDKAIYVFVPEMIRFYLGEEPILPNVPTWRCSEPDDCAYVLDHLPELVVKQAQGSGGYGMLIGNAATQSEIEDFAARIKADPAAYIAQPILALSGAPSLTEQGMEPRHVDLRPFVITGRETKLIPGGLTRVALREGSLVVNSSQGGGVKDTWVLREGFDA